MRVIPATFALLAIIMGAAAAPEPEPVAAAAWSDTSAAYTPDIRPLFCVGENQRCGPRFGQCCAGQCVHIRFRLNLCQGGWGASEDEEATGF